MFRNAINTFKVRLGITMMYCSTCKRSTQHKSTIFGWFCMEKHAILALLLALSLLAPYHAQAKASSCSFYVGTKGKQVHAVVTGVVAIYRSGAYLGNYADVDWNVGSVGKGESLANWSCKASTVKINKPVKKTGK